MNYVAAQIIFPLIHLSVRPRLSVNTLSTPLILGQHLSQWTVSRELTTYGSVSHRGSIEMSIVFQSTGLLIFRAVAEP